MKILLKMFILQSLLYSSYLKFIDSLIFIKKIAQISGVSLSRTIDFGL